MSGHKEGHHEHMQCDHSQGRGHFQDDDHLIHLMQKEEFTLEDWVEIYEKMPSSKVITEPSKELVNYIKELLPSEPAKVLVPLCGKSPDMRWLYDRGNTVVGLEGIEKPVKDFFDSYPDLQHSVENVSFGKLYKSHDGRLQVYVCNVTEVPKGALGQFDAAFDWGAYTAIKPSDRQRYVDVVKDAMKEDFRYFIEVCHDGPPGAVGMPHSISFRTIKLEFGVSLYMKVLSTKDVSTMWEVETYFNSFILLSNKEL